MTRASVLQVIGNYDYAGIAHVATELGLRLRKDFDVTLACTRVIRKPEANLDLLELKPRNTLGLWRSLQKLIGDYDIVHTHDVYALPGLFKRSRRSRIVYTDHGIVPFKYSRTRSLDGIILAHACEMLFANKADFSVGISDYIANDLTRRLGCRNVVKIPNGIDLTKFRPIDKSKLALKDRVGRPLLLKVGIVEKHKAIEYHLASMCYVRQKFPNASLILVGTGRYFEYYSNLVKRLGLDHFVSLTGYIPDKEMPLYYNSADVVIEVSYWHSFGLPILEGMACGKPVITRDAYAMREHISKSGAGVMVQGNEPREVAAAVERIMSNYDEYVSKARKYAEGFDWNIVAAQYENAYKKLLENVDRKQL